ncbi:MAG: trypsin-like peptidase domain-containing protein [Bacillota bacterium]
MKDRQEFYNYRAPDGNSYRPAQPHRSKVSFWGILFGIIAICLVAGISGYIGASLATQDDNKLVVYVSPDNTVSSDTDIYGNLTISGVYNANSDSVVEVHTQSYVSYTSASSTNAGSGVIWADGYVVTNYHVVSDATQIYVTFSDGETTVNATLHSKDEELDIAILAVSATNMQPVTLGNSDNLSVGQTVVSIGNPLGTLGGTITDGIISALDRSVVVDNISMNLLQTNAAVSPGNSGGGLFDMSGNLIGIVNAQASADDAEGIGFAIPINDVKDVVEQLFAKSYVSDRVDVDTVVLNEVTVVSQLYPLTGLMVAGTNTTSAYNTFDVCDYILSVGGVEISTIAEWDFQLRKYSVGDTIIIAMGDRYGGFYDVYYTLEAITA